MKTCTCWSHFLISTNLFLNSLGTVFKEDEKEFCKSRQQASFSRFKTNSIWLHKTWSYWNKAEFFFCPKGDKRIHPEIRTFNYLPFSDLFSLHYVADFCFHSNLPQEKWKNKMPRLLFLVSNSPVFYHTLYSVSPRWGDIWFRRLRS